MIKIVLWIEIGFGPVIRATITPSRQSKSPLEYPNTRIADGEISVEVFLLNYRPTKKFVRVNENCFDNILMGKNGADNILS